MGLQRDAGTETPSPGQSCRLNRDNTMNFKSLALLIAAVASLAGCANTFNPAGDSHYDCNRKENPDSPYCHSFRAVEEATNGAVPSSRYDEQMDIAVIDRLQGIAPVSRDGNRAGSTAAAAGSLADVQLPHQLEAGELPDGTPVRVAPIVQRTWIAPHRDRNDVLHGEEYLHKEIAPSRWAGHPPVTTAANGLRGGAAIYPHRAPTAAAMELTKVQQPQSSKAVAPSANFNQPGATKTQDHSQTDLTESSSSLPN
ncbi:hypothetical protein DBR42_00820 [Pelomonas sp. HMWF004]|nr:hypothetical protein DBR42_00820 [Pelomonas sp. HMWF004]